jgi:hypothetical protein
VADTEGDYRAILPDDIPFTARRPYVARIDADGGTDRIGHWRFQFTPQIRSE